MGKRLVLILACALVVGLTLPVFAEVQNVKVSGDITALGISRSGFNLDNTVDGVQKADDKESHAASIIRLRVDADLTENVGATVRLLNERDWDNEIAATNDIDLDLAYITLREFLYSPLTLTIGRQELHFGNDFIIGDPDTNNQDAAGSTLTDADLSARKAFDAFRATLDFKPLVIDAFWAKIDENSVLGTNAAPEKDDIDAFGVNAKYDFGGNWKTIGETYWFARVDNSVRDATTIANKKKTFINNIGGRFEINPIERLILQGEAAYQFGKINNTTATIPQQDHRAWAAQGVARYALNMKYNPVLMTIYSFYSGDKDGTQRGSSRGWDVMFENQTNGHIANVLFNATGAHIVDIRGSVNPIEDLSLTLDFVYFRLAEEPVAADLVTTFTPAHGAITHGHTDNRWLGNELDVNLNYDYTEDVQLGLLAGWFFPGDLFNAKSAIVASEVIASCKVAF